ncbi:MAG: GNAT family N-acetyltransferase [Candidatus Fimadaptatus sp.]
MEGKLLDELYALFRRNLPFAVRAEDTARRILGDAGNHVLVRRGPDGALIAAAVIHEGAIYLLCVDAAHRRAGLGSGLLMEAEGHMRAQGVLEARVGAGADYLTPGVPTDAPPWAEGLPRVSAPGLSGAAQAFFEKRGYRHSWGECNCFDMSMSLDELPPDAPHAGDAVEGVRYRWAEARDRAGVCACMDGAHAAFTRYYAAPELYTGAPAQRVLIAEAQGGVRGALIVSREAEGRGLGSVGCTAVTPDWRGRHIAANMVLAGTRSLRDAGLKRAFLGYTYSGLERLYGRAGYSICAYYFMAQKRL